MSILYPMCAEYRLGHPDVYFIVLGNQHRKVCSDLSYRFPGGFFNCREGIMKTCKNILLFKGFKDIKINAISP